MGYETTIKKITIMEILIDYEKMGNIKDILNSNNLELSQEECDEIEKALNNEYFYESEDLKIYIV